MTTIYGLPDYSLPPLVERDFAPIPGEYAWRCLGCGGVVKAGSAAEIAAQFAVHSCGELPESGWTPGREVYH